MFLDVFIPYWSFAIILYIKEHVWINKRNLSTPLNISISTPWLKILSQDIYLVIIFFSRLQHYICRRLGSNLLEKLPYRLDIVMKILGAIKRSADVIQGTNHRLQISGVLVLKCNNSLVVILKVWRARHSCPVGTERGIQQAVLSQIFLPNSWNQEV